MQCTHQATKLSTGRIAVAVFIAATVWKVWLPTPSLPAAQAQIPDSGLQRQQILDEVRKTNQLLADVREFAKGHTFKVRIEGTDNKSAPQ
ncbi:MAG: hypothetical protein HOP29_05810 [Phycisphaerales bacterium]|nr:hypothetical protein [Phycisphaerales bacterium]